MMEENGERMKFNRQFELDTVHMAEQGNRQVSEVAGDLGIDPNTLVHRKRALSEHGAEAFPGNGRLMLQEEELRRSQRENATQGRRIPF